MTIDNPFKVEEGKTYIAKYGGHDVIYCKVTILEITQTSILIKNEDSGNIARYSLQQWIFAFAIQEEIKTNSNV